MPKEEVEIEVSIPKGPKGKKPRVPGAPVPAGRGRPSSSGVTSTSANNGPTTVAPSTPHLPPAPAVPPGSTATTTVPALATPASSHGTHNSLPQQVRKQVRNATVCANFYYSNVFQL